MPRLRRGDESNCSPITFGYILVMIQALTSYRAYPSKQPQVRYTLRYGTDGLVLFSRN